MTEYTNKIRDLRIEKSMTQLRLSIELEVSQETVSTYEIGKHYPSARSLIRMAELFDASTDYILGLNPVRKMIPLLRAMADCGRKNDTRPVRNRHPAQ